jgi:hypothetical protein
MVEQDEWVFFRDIDWEDEKFNVFSVDTRDFHCGYRFEKDFSKIEKDYNKIIKNKENFILSKSDLIKLLERYYTTSGGKKDWRFFSLEGLGDNWALKYLRIWRNEFGFIVCDSNNYAIKKENLEKEVNKEYLH